MLHMGSCVLVKIVKVFLQWNVYSNFYGPTFFIIVIIVISKPAGTWSLRFVLIKRTVN